MKIRRFRAGDGLTLVLPVALKTAPGAQSLKLDDKTVIELDFDDPRVQLHQRFLSIEIANGDLVEVTDPAVVTTPPTVLAEPPDPPTTTAPFEINP